MGTLVRPAAHDDIPFLAPLLAELYRYELPGMLRGPMAKRVLLMEWLLRRVPLDDYVVAAARERVVGMGGLATRERPRPPVPPGLARAIVRHLGWAHGVSTVVGAVRGLRTVAPVLDAGAAQLHSIVVEPNNRGAGIGSALVAALEDRARAMGKATAVVQVVATNTDAVAVYEATGYAARTGSGRRRSLLAYPTVELARRL